MDVLFRRGRATAAEVMEELSGEPSYSTVRTQLRVLEEKGHVRHDEDGVRFIYMPAVARHAARKWALRHLVETFFEGSPEKAVAALLGGDGAKLSDEQLQRMADMIAQGARGGEMTLLLSIVIDVTVVCLIALLALALLRRQSAALRHAVLIVAIVVTALVPLLEIVLPPLPILAVADRCASSASSSVTVTSGPVVTDVTAPRRWRSPRCRRSHGASCCWRSGPLAPWSSWESCGSGSRIWRASKHGRAYARKADGGPWRTRSPRSLVLRRRITILHSPDPVLLVTYRIRHTRLLCPLTRRRGQTNTSGWC